MTIETIEYTAEEIAANRKTWVDALRSGDYEQRKSYLKHNGSYCCLGVGSEVLGEPVEREGIGGELVLMGIPTCEFAEKVGFAGVSGVTSIVDLDGAFTSLTVLNDTWDYSFAEIADLIDEGVLLPPGEFDHLFSEYVTSPLPGADE